MTQDEIDTMWQQAMKESIKDGAIYTRHHFAKVIAEAEREACAKACEEAWTRHQCAAAIRARGQA